MGEYLSHGPADKGCTLLKKATVGGKRLQPMSQKRPYVRFHQGAGYLQVFSQEVLLAVSSLEGKLLQLGVSLRERDEPEEHRV